MAELTIEDVLEHYGADLTRVPAYKWAKVKCPFHDDRIASASVYLEQDSFACHACDVHGDPLNTIARAEGFGTKEHPDRRAANEWAKQEFGEDFHLVSRTANEPEPRSTWRDRLLS